MTDIENAVTDAMRQLRDAIRAEVLAEAIEALREYRAGLDDGDGGEGYIDGIDDAITTIEQLG